MSIILEGPDRAGKTTLAEALRLKFGSDIVHLGGSEILGKELIRHWDKVQAEMNHGQTNTVYDRMVIGSMVYAFKKDSHNIQPATPAEFTEWIDWLEKGRNVLICCLPPLETILKRMEVGEDYITRDDMVIVYRRYQTLFKGFMDNGLGKVPVLFYDSDRTSPMDYIALNEKLLKAALS